MTKPPRTKLELEKLTELSLVDVPANQHAAVRLFKRAGAMGRGLFGDAWAQLQAALDPITKDAQTFAESLAVTQMWDLQSALSSSVSSIIADESLAGDAMASRLDEAWGAFRSAVLALADNAEAFTPAAKADGDEADDEEDDTKTAPAGGDVGKGASSASSVADALASAGDPGPGEQGTEHNPAPDTGETMKTQAPKFDNLEAANAAIAKLHEQVETLTEAAEVAADPLAAITKGMTPAAAAAFKAMSARVESLEKNSADAQTIAKAQTIARGTKVKAEDVQKALKQLDADGVAVLETLAKTNRELARELASYGGESGQVGGRGSDVTNGAAKAELETLAKAYQQANPGTSYAVAVVKVLETRDDLYDAHDAEYMDGAEVVEDGDDAE